MKKLGKEGKTKLHDELIIKLQQGLVVSNKSLTNSSLQLQNIEKQLKESNQKLLHASQQLKVLEKIFKKNDIPFPEELKDTKSNKILIVDDDKSIINLLTKILKYTNENYVIESAIDGFEAKNKIDSFQPDLVILDLNLPFINGFELCEKIKTCPNTKNTKILVITGYYSELTKKRIYEHGADGYLFKPLYPDELIKQVKNFLD
ncbi:PleD family two-component system response regulator [bacterium]